MKRTLEDLGIDPHADPEQYNLPDLLTARDAWAETQGPEGQSRAADLDLEIRRRLRLLTDGHGERTVEISWDTADVALRELEILIKETGGGAGHDMGEGEEEQAMSPLALARHRIMERREEVTDSSISLGLGLALQIISDVSEETGAEISPIDPLQDDIFRARDELTNALGGER